MSGQKNNDDIEKRKAAETLSGISKQGSKMESKWWRLKPVAGGSKAFEFRPTFIVSEDTDEVETRWIDIKVDGKVYRFNFLDIFMFIYFTANEELRRGLAYKQMKKVTHIPYDVTVKLTEEEKKKGTAKRRIKLRVDELTMAVARNEAQQIVKYYLSKGKIEDLSKGRLDKK